MLGNIELTDSFSEAALNQANAALPARAVLWLAGQLQAIEREALINKCARQIWRV